MKDSEIIDYFFQRNEMGLRAAAERYSNYCSKIAYNILGSREDAEECVNSVFLASWDSIPPYRPENLAAYLGKLTRSSAIDIQRKQNALKRGAGQLALVLEELEDCVSDGREISEEAEFKELVDTLKEFLKTLPQIQQSICILRYSRLEPVAEIAQRLNLKESYVLTTLFRARKKLKAYLMKRGFEV